MSKLRPCTDRHSAQPRTSRTTATHPAVGRRSGSIEAGEGTAGAGTVIASSQALGLSVACSLHCPPSLRSCAACCSERGLSWRSPLSWAGRRGTSAGHGRGSTRWQRVSKHRMVCPSWREFVRSDGFCLVTCTRGGEAVITVVLDASELIVDAACEEVRRSVQDLSGEAVHERLTGIDDAQCVYTGDLYDDAGIIGIVARRVDLHKLRGTRWMEEEPFPNVLA